MLIIVFFFNGREITEFKADNKNVNFLTQFWLESMTDRFSATDSKEESLNGDVHDFSVDYDSVDKSDILNIHKYLMAKNDIN